MRALRHRLRRSRALRIRAGVAVLVCLAATLLLGSLAAAQEDPPAGETPASDSSVDEELEAPESDEADAEAEPSDEDVTSAEAVEEFLVTARKIEILVPDTTVSVIGFDPERLRAEGIKDIRDLSNFTPSLDIQSAFAASNPTIFIRGVGLDDYNANAANAVAIYQDGVYMASPAGQLFQFFDTERVEVLRGPQPTLYRNASAGAILVDSAAPTDELDGYVSSTYGRFNQVETEGALGGPIVPGWLSGRLSGLWGIRDGITKNRCAIRAPVFGPCNQFGEDGVQVVQPGINKYTNDVDAFAARGQLLFKPQLDESEMSWLLNGHGGKNLGRAFQYQNRGTRYFDPSEVPGCAGSSQDSSCRFIPKPLDPPQPDGSLYTDTDNDPFAGDYNIDGPEKLSLWGANLKGSWLLGGYEIVSVTGYEWHERFILENSDGNPRTLLKQDYGDNAWQLSEQLEVRGDWSESEVGDGNWVLGAYYLQEDLDVDNFFEPISGTDLRQEYTQRTRNFAPYAWSEYKMQLGCEGIPCNFTLTSGLRYNVEFKAFDTSVCADPGFGFCQTALDGNDNDLWSGLGGEISLAWNYSEEGEAYIKYSRGWKGGHFNGGAVSSFDVITAAKPEIVESYEAGLRSYWFDQRLMLNATTFYYDYQDLQVFILEQTPLGFPIPKLVNATDATVYGVELDLGATPLENLTFTYNFAWVKSQYNDFHVSLPFTLRPENRPGTVPRPAFTIRKDFDYSGNPLVASPEFSMTGSAGYEIPLGEIKGWPLGSLTPRFSFSWKDDVFYDASSGEGALSNYPEGTFGQEAYWVFNGTLTWRSQDERFEVMGWVHNFMDQHYKTESFDLSRGFNLILDAWDDPRTYGVTATFYF